MLLLDQMDNIVSLRLLGDGPGHGMTLLLGGATLPSLYPAPEELAFAPGQTLLLSCNFWAIFLIWPGLFNFLSEY